MRKNRLNFFICIVLAGFYYTNTAFAGTSENHGTKRLSDLSFIAIFFNIY